MGVQWRLPTTPEKEGWFFSTELVCLLIANLCLLSAPERVIKFPVRVLRETMPKPRNITRSHQREMQNQGGEEWPPCADRRYRVHTRLVLLGAV